MTSKNEDEKMRVLFLSDHLGYPDGITHGATTYFTNVLPHLACSDVELTVCFLRERHASARRLEAMGVKPLFLHRSKWDPRALSDLVDIIRDRDIQIVHAAGMKGTLFGRIAAHICNCHAVVHLHDTRHPGVILAALQRMVSCWTGMAVVVSEAVGKLAVNTLGIPQSRIATMHNPIDMKRYISNDSTRCRVRRELHISDEAHVIGMTSRLSAEKGHCAFLRCMPRILAKHPEAVLVIAGDGPMRRACEQVIDELGIGHCVRMLGNRSDIPDILAAVDVIALPSSREGLPYSALEAMAAGRPVVSFAVGGMVELVRDGKTGILVSPGDGHAMADAIVRVLTDHTLAEELAESARASIRTFSVESHIRELRFHYRNILDDETGMKAIATWVGQ